MLADYGFMTLRVSSDWQSADFIAQHVDGVSFLKVQLKGSFAIDKDYEGKDLYICFPDRPFPGRSTWFLCLHDMLVSQARSCTNICNTDSWITHGTYRAAKPPASLVPFLDRFALQEIEASGDVL